MTLSALTSRTNLRDAVRVIEEDHLHDEDALESYIAKAWARQMVSA